MRKVSLFILLICTLPMNACAQWYLFPGKKKAENKEITVAPIVEEIIDNPEKSENELLEDFVSNELSVINIVLALPLEAKSEKPNSNFIEMYSGALLALREIAESGTKFKLTVIDTKDDNADFACLNTANVIIGPVSYNEILRTLPLCPNNQMIISPLDQKALSLANNSNVIQAPVPQQYQIEEIVKWIEEDLLPDERLLIIRDSSNGGSDIVSLIESKALPHSFISNISNYAFENGKTYRIIIASDNDAFHAGATRNIAIEAERNPKSKLILYCNSRIRSSISQNVADLYKANARMTAAYHIDYESPLVKEFILKYRSLFHSEPGSFAFQGYDAVKYYVSACEKYGRKWYLDLDKYSWRGLQSDFSFDKHLHKGRVNRSVRRIVYNKDFSTVLQ